MALLVTKSQARKHKGDISEILHATPGNKADKQAILRAQGISVPRTTLEIMAAELIDRYEIDDALEAAFDVALWLGHERTLRRIERALRDKVRPLPAKAHALDAVFLNPEDGEPYEVTEVFNAYAEAAGCPLSDLGWREVINEAEGEGNGDITEDESLEDGDEDDGDVLAATRVSTRTHVFLCYSQKDTKWMRLLKDHLSPLARGGLLHEWDDQHIEPGRDWRQEIETALATTRVVVPIITKNFLNSNFIQTVELPTLLGARERGEVQVLCLFAESSVVASVSVSFVDSRTGKTKEIKLTDLQGLNAPDKTLDHKSGPQRNKLVAGYATHILRLMQG